VTVAAATAVTALLVVGILASTGEAIRAIRAERTQTRLKEAAQASEQKAKAAEAGQARLRERAEAEELAARQRAYASDMHVAKQALDGSNLGHAQDLLNRQRPQPGQKDLRGWEWRYLWHQTHSDALLTLCEKSAIESLAVSPDGNWLAIGLVRKDGLFVWDLKTRQEVAHLVPGEDEVRAVFSPAEPLLAFTSLAPEKRQASLRLWNTATREMMAQLPLSGNCGGLAFAKDGRTLVTSTAGGLINLWRVADGIKLASYPSEQFVDFTSAGFAVTADLGLAAYGLEAGQIRVVDLRDGRAVWTSAAAKDQVRALAFSPDGKTLASAAGFTESDIRLWDVGTGREIGRLEGHNRWVGALLFWPDGQKLASASADQTIRTWDVASRKCLDVLRGHRLEVWRLALLPDNKTLVSGSKDGAVCLWDTSVTHPRRESTTLPDDIAFWRFTPDSRSVVTLDNEGRVARWSGSGFQEKEAWLEVGRDWLYAGGGYAGANFSADGRFLALGATNGTVTVWDVSRRGIRREFKPGEGNANPLDVLAEGNRVLVWQRASIHVAEWDMEANREIQSWPVPAGWWCFKLSPDERLWVAIGPDGDVTGRNLPEHISANWPIRVLEGYRAAFSADGQLFAVASSEGFARVWRTATWRKEATLRGFLNAVDSVAFSPDGKRLITGGSNPDDAVKLWDVDSWQETLTLEGTGHSFDPTAFSTDGNAIGAKNQDGILRLWQAPSWEEIAAAEARERGEVRQP
jgi:WD40 repeat protein